MPIRSLDSRPVNTFLGADFNKQDLPPGQQKKMEKLASDVTKRLQEGDVKGAQERLEDMFKALGLSQEQAKKMSEDLLNALGLNTPEAAKAGCAGGAPGAEAKGAEQPKPGDLLELLMQLLMEDPAAALALMQNPQLLQELARNPEMLKKLAKNPEMLKEMAKLAKAGGPMELLGVDQFQPAVQPKVNI